jgi:hypothetical protein
VLDDCDPATFNAMFGPGTCVKDGTTTFQAFIAQLLAQGRAPAWRFAPAQGLRSDAGAGRGHGDDRTAAAGVHRYECLIHPRMQTTVTVG